jgi:hypothetical protein
MARISYVTPEAVTDPQIRRWLDDAIAAGRPGPENQAIRAHQPDVMRSFTLTREMLFDNGAGVVEHDLKEMLRAYVAFTIECGY